MDELWELQQQFMQVQETRSNPLSDRTLVQLLLKLPQLGLVFYQTTDGSEYVTQQSLDEQLRDIVKERGRVEVSQLPTLTGLSADVIESRLSIVTHKHGLVRVDTQLFSPNYLDSLVQLVREKLEVRGSLNMEDVAREFGFPISYTRKFVSERIAEIGADLLNEQLVTKQYNQRRKAKLAGCLNGTTRPTLLSQLLKTYSVDDRNASELVDQLIQERRVNGRISQGSYIPQQFESKQKSIIDSYLSTNSYLEYSMLQKTFCISRPKEWLAANLKGKVVLLEDAAYSCNALESCKNSVLGLLGSEGFFDLSKVFPSAFSDSDVEILFNEHLNLSEVVLSSGYAFDPKWLDRCTREFRDKIIHAIFFKEDSKSRKKATKKKITIDEMCEVLLDDGLVSYIELEDLKEVLYQLLQPRLDTFYNRCMDEVTQSKGVLTSSLMKYRKCKTIASTLEKCSKIIAAADKQFKKNEKHWEDPDFGPNETDKNGLLSLLYFDKISPKEWPSLQKVEWRSVDIITEGRQKTTLGTVRRGKHLSKSKLADVLQLLESYNLEFPARKVDLSRLLCPEFEQAESKDKLMAESGANVVRLTVEGNSRYVIVDNLIPFLNGEPFGCRSNGSIWPSLIEKAYAKLRYCYKGILGVGFVQLVQELTGMQVTRKTPADWQLMSQFRKTAENKEQFWGYLSTVSKSQLVALATEGETDADVDYDGEPSGFMGNSVYLLSGLLDRKEGRLVRLRADIKASRALILESTDQTIIQQQANGYVFLTVEQMYLLFRNIYVVFNSTTASLEMSFE